MPLEGWIRLEKSQRSSEKLRDGYKSLEMSIERQMKARVAQRTLKWLEELEYSGRKAEMTERREKWPKEGFLAWVCMQERRKRQGINDLEACWGFGMGIGLLADFLKKKSKKFTVYAVDMASHTTVSPPLTQCGQTT